MPGSSIGKATSRLAACFMMFSWVRSSPHCLITCTVASATT